MAGGQKAGAPETPRMVGGIAFQAQVMAGVTGKDLPALVDEMKARIGSGVVLLVAEAEGKAAVAAGVTSDLTDRLSAVDVLRAAVAALGGKGGGGRADLAQGGAASAADSEAAFRAAETVIGAAG